MKRTKEDTIQLFKNYATDLKKQAVRAKDATNAAFYRGKAEAYELAAFEIEHNMR